jgi:hypothetical protein
MRLTLALLASAVTIQAASGQQSPPDKGSATVPFNWNVTEPWKDGGSGGELRAQTIDPCNIYKFSWCGDTTHEPENPPKGPRT